MLFALMFFAIGCGNTNDSEPISDGDLPAMKMVFKVQVDELGCPSNDYLEGGHSDYPLDRLPRGVAKVLFNLYAKTGELLLETEVAIQQSCDDPVHCMTSDAQGFILYGVPTQSDMRLEAIAMDADSNILYTGNNYDVSIVTEQDNPSTQAVPVELFMHRVGAMTRGFDCMDFDGNPLLGGKAFHSATLQRDGKSVIIMGGVWNIGKDACNRQDICKQDCPGCSQDALNECAGKLDVDKCDALAASNNVALFDLETGAFTQLGKLQYQRAGHRAILLRDARILVMGGAQTLWMRDGYEGRGYIEAKYSNIVQFAELYDPSGNGQSIQTIPMAEKRIFFSVTPMNETEESPIATRFLIAGGWGEGGRLSSMEIFEYDTMGFRRTGNALATPRMGHTATLLPNGHVFFYGGAEPNKPVGEVFKNESEATDTLSDVTGSNAWYNLYYHDAQPIASNGYKVLMAGGITKNKEWTETTGAINYGERTFLETFDEALLVDLTPGARTSYRFKLNHGRAFVKLFGLPNDDVLVFGGASGSNLQIPALNVEFFRRDYFGILQNDNTNVALGRISEEDAGYGRIGHTITRLPSGAGLIVGGLMPDPVEGDPNNKTPLPSAELYQPTKAQLRSETDGE